MAWQSAIQTSHSLWTTLALGAMSSGVALLWCLAWLECTPTRWRRALQRLVFIPLVMPGLLWTLGLYQLALHFKLDGSASGVVLAHTLSVLPYAFIALAPAYTQFDTRYAQLSSSFGKSYAVFLWKVKWPMLRTAIASSLAVGFAVSVALYLPTLFVGAGRIATVTTEAIGLSSGGQRSLLAAFAVLQTALPLVAFAWANHFGSPRNHH
jgi:putative thiamine transport system permease protein